MLAPPLSRSPDTWCRMETAALPIIAGWPSAGAGMHPCHWRELSLHTLDYGGGSLYKGGSCVAQD